MNHMSNAEIMFLVLTFSSRQTLFSLPDLNAILQDTDRTVLGVQNPLPRGANSAVADSIDVAHQLSLHAYSATSPFVSETIACAKFAHTAIRLRLGTLFATHAG
jgi:hypothetical protein